MIQCFVIKMACVVARRNLLKFGVESLGLQVFCRTLSSIDTKVTVINKNIKLLQAAHDSQNTVNSKKLLNGHNENRDFQQKPTKPLALILSWLFAKPSHVRKYGDLYLKQGFDVLTVQVQLGQVLIPQRAQSVMRNVCDLLTQSEKQLVLVHAFSVGAYLFGEVLVQLLEHPELYGNIANRLCGQILDSPVDYYGIPKGFSKAMSENSHLRAGIKSFLEWYLKSLSLVVTKHYIRSSNVFLANNLKLPSRFLYSLSDPVCESDKIEEQAEKWRRNGIDADTKFWDNAHHVSMFMKHPDDYERTVVQFIMKSGIKEHQRRITGQNELVTNA